MRNHTENKLGVALVKRACPICATPHDAEIVMNTRLSVPMAQRVEEMHGKVVGEMEEPCKECKELMSKGFLCVQVDEAKTEDHRNPWRTGKQCVVKLEAMKRLITDHKLLDKGIAFIPIDAWEKMGLP
jgi:hypothetical protein